MTFEFVTRREVEATSSACKCLWQYKPEAQASEFSHIARVDMTGPRLAPSAHWVRLPTASNFKGMVMTPFPFFAGKFAPPNPRGLARD